MVRTPRHCRFELEVSVTCSKGSDSFTRLAEAWLPDTRQAADLYRMWWWWVGRPLAHQSAQLSERRKKKIKHFATATSATAPDSAFWIWGRDRRSICNSRDVPWQVTEISALTKLIGKSVSFPVSHMCWKQQISQFYLRVELLPPVKTAVAVPQPR